jgi:Transcriptional regulator containing PAS, AAA-type ATPase, and DNA-binding domains
MKYEEVMEILSQCGTGAVLTAQDCSIIAVNDAGDKLLHGGGALAGKSLQETAPVLCSDSEDILYDNPVFGEYLLRIPGPELSDLPDGSRMIYFRDATNDACHDMLISVFNQLNEAIALYDADARVYLLNNAVTNLESIVTQDVRGQAADTVYQYLDGTELSITQVLREKHSVLDEHVHYTTRFGRNVDVVASDYPITQNGQTLGAFCVMEDYSKIDDLHKQIMDLQGKLMDTAMPGKHRAKSILRPRYTFKNIIYVNDGMSNVVAQCKQIAKGDSSVMIYGETGTGKELFAQSIHNASRRADDPFLAINCAAIPESLLEGLLFGTEKGAYTGAESRPGLFEQANHGTLLLDEINSMDINLQSKLLRVLQEGTVRRVGGAYEIDVDVRVLSNINIPPNEAIENNKLRRDLFYRLGVVNISIPPLRDRKDDIPLLSKHFIIQYNKKLGKNITDIDAQTLELFYAYEWPGNVRELQHAIEHAMNIMPDGYDVITPEFIPEHIADETNVAKVMGTPAPALPEGSFHNTMHDIELRTICKILQENNGNISKSARELKMSRQSLQYRIKRFQIDIDKLLGRDQ